MDKIEKSNLKQNLSVAVFGHVDSGKSTTFGHLLSIFADDFQKTILHQIRENNQGQIRNSFYYAHFLTFILKQISECSLADHNYDSYQLKIPNYNYQIIDYSSYRDFTYNISIANAKSQIDVSVLIVSASLGEFEAGFSKCGQTRLHIQLSQLLGIRNLIICINKMDDNTVNYSKIRFDEIEQEIDFFLRKNDINFKNVLYIPISGYFGMNLVSKSELLPWYNGKTLYEALNNISPPIKPEEQKLRVFVQNIFKINNIGVAVQGKVESGILQINKPICFYPFSGVSQAQFEVLSIQVDNQEISEGLPGYNICFLVKNLQLKDIQKGAICGYSDEYFPRECKSFTAKIIVINHPNIIMEGYSPVIQINSLSVLCELQQIIKINNQDKKKQQIVKQEDIALVNLKPNKPINVDTFSSNPYLGKLIIRDKDQIVAVGIVMQVHYN